jgi:ATP-dependent Clp protease ATP-binding subunit ClpC
VSTKSLRVYFVTHHDGRKTGILMRAWNSFFDAAPPSAYGANEAEVLSLLEQALLRAEADGSDSIDRYLWAETFQVQKTRVDVRPLTTVKKRPVIGKATIPLRVSYAWTKVKASDEARSEVPRTELPHAYRVMLPRFGMWFVLEDLDAAGEVLSSLLSFWLMGEQPRWVYDFRAEGEEYVRPWSPDLLARRGERSGDDEEAPPPELGKVADDLVALLARGKLAPVVGEAPELPQIAAAAARTPLPSLLLVGPAGAGKSALVRRTARLLVERAREAKRRGRPKLWSTSSDRIVAGMVWLGQWQQRVFALLEELSGRNEWLYVDRLSALARPQPDGTSIAEMFEPALASGELSLLAEATPSELEQLSRRHASLVQRFRVVRVDERSAEASALLIAPYAARKPTLTLDEAAVRRLVRHVADVQHDQALPGKAFRFVDWLAASTAEKKAFRARDVSEAFSRFTGIPVELLSDEYAASAADLSAKLRERVIGQDEACAACGRLLARFKAGMNDPERPSGTLLFVGPTGVGKTELAKQLARVTFGDAARLARVDMSEYGLRGSARRLLEVGEGVTSLAQQVSKQPLSLVLLDEIEKAHPDVFDLLLGVLGEGRLTDSSGRLVDFRGTIVVMTSNLGVTDRSTLGFGASGAGDYVRAVRQHFRPELFNRIDAVLSFRPLSPADVERIVDLTLDEVRSRAGLARRGLSLAVSARARAELARIGFHPTMGARPLKRTVEERVVTPLAAALSADASLRDRAFAVVTADESVPPGATAVVL